MADLVELVRKTLLQGLHKKKGDKNFGDLLNDSAKKKRISKFQELRKSKRTNLILEKRNIQTIMTPAITPAKPKTNNPQNTEKRLEMLMKWKLDKERKKEQAKQKTKPVFKVCHIPVPLGVPNLENVNLEIKGKPFKSSFAPSNHLFKPPKNIKPLQFASCSSNSDNACEQVSKVNLSLKTHSDSKISGRRSPIITRSRILQSQGNKVNVASVTKRADNENLKPPKIKQIKKGTVNRQIFAQNSSEPESQQNSEILQKMHVRSDTNSSGHNTRKRHVKLEPEDLSKHLNGNKSPLMIEGGYPMSSGAVLSQSSLSPDYPIRSISNEQGTPPKQVDLAHVYVSPFVTLSRGKDKARKEYAKRKSKGGRTPIDDQNVTATGPQAGATYFRKILDNEISRLKSLCSKWDTCKQDVNVPHEAVDLIDVAIGQTNLLIAKKFCQFRTLIQQCEADNPSNVVTCEDLHGFWDMMYMQVIDLDTRFANLAILKANNWQEAIPEKVKPVTKKKVQNTKKGQATSAIREAIKAAKLKKQNKELDSNISTSVGLPTVCNDSTSKKTRLSRKSLLSVSATSENKRVSSPGLIMMRVVKLAKGLETMTPGKSILKTDTSKSTGKSKMVLFKDDAVLDNSENDLNKLNVSPPSSEGNHIRRRSSRLGRASDCRVKLF